MGLRRVVQFEFAGGATSIRFGSRLDSVEERVAGGENATGYFNIMGKASSAAFAFVSGLSLDRDVKNGGTSDFDEGIPRK